MTKFEFTKEDWESKDADYSAFLTFIALASIFALALSLTLTPFTLATIALALILTFILALTFTYALATIALALALIDESNPRCYYIYRFLGAWWHHRKNNRSV